MRFALELLKKKKRVSSCMCFVCGCFFFLSFFSYAEFGRSLGGVLATMSQSFVGRRVCCCCCKPLN